MSALYAMRYLGQSGIGMGVIYIGKGVIVGVDVTNGRYSGMRWSHIVGQFGSEVKVYSVA